MKAQGPERSGSCAWGTYFDGAAPGLPAVLGEMVTLTVMSGPLLFMNVPGTVKVYVLGHDRVNGNFAI